MATDRDVYELRRLIATAFQDSQKNAASHRKLVASLQKVYITAFNNGLYDHFQLFFFQMINKVLPVKRTVLHSNRVVKFVGDFLHLIASSRNENEARETDLTSNLVLYLLPGLQSKDKNVRYRCLQIIATSVAAIQFLSDRLFIELFKNVKGRVFDKEVAMRTQAVHILCLLQGGSGDDDEDETDQIIENLLLNRLQNDPSAEVRRTVLKNIVANTRTLPYIVERAWDVDATTRRTFFSKSMKEIGDFRLMSIQNRENVLQRGLNDRDESAKHAAINMFVNDWMSVVDNDINELLERLDVSNSSVAGQALEQLFQSRPQALENIHFSEEFWTNLDTENVFLARTFNAYCLKQKETELLDKRMPELTQLAHYLEYYFKLKADIDIKLELEPNNDSGLNEEEPSYILEQLLTIAETYDFADEIGRRNVLNLLRRELTILRPELVSRDELSPSLVRKTVEVMRKLAVSERDFSQILLEVITDIRDDMIPSTEVGGESRHRREGSVDSDDSFTTAKSTQHGTQAADGSQSVSKPVNSETQYRGLVRCLYIAQSLLELIESPLQDNIHIKSLIKTLIEPALQSEVLTMKTISIRCLGLSCLHDRATTERNFKSFVDHFERSYERGDLDAACEMMKIVCDILMIHGEGVMNSDPSWRQAVLKMYFRGIRKSSEPTLQALAVEIMFKLLLADIMYDDELLQAIVVCYFDGATANNDSLRQTLTFCLPAYCHSKPLYQERLASVSVLAFERIAKLREESAEDMVTLSQVLEQLVYWTDPRKSVALEEATSESEIQVDVCISMLQCMAQTKDKAARKALCLAANKLYIPATTDGGKLQMIRGLTDPDDYHIKHSLDAIARNAIAKLRARVEELLPVSDDDGASSVSASVAATPQPLDGLEDTSVQEAGEATEGVGEDADSSLADISMGVYDED